MDNVFSDLEQMVDALTEPFSDYAPRRLRLMVDYKDETGMDFHQEVLALHPNGATDESLVQSIKEKLPGLTAIAELLPGDKWSALYIAPGYLEEYAAEIGLTLPPNIGETLDNAGIHPVNLEELKNGRYIVTEESRRRGAGTCRPAP